MNFRLLSRKPIDARSVSRAYRCSKRDRFGMVSKCDHFSMAAGSERKKRGGWVDRCIPCKGLSRMRYLLAQRAQMVFHAGSDAAALDSFLDRFAARPFIEQGFFTLAF